MPDTVLPPSIQSELADILRRLRAVETFQSNLSPATAAATYLGLGKTLTLLGQVSGAGASALAFYNAGGGNFNPIGSGSGVPQFAISIATAAQVLVYGEMASFFGSGGTASYVTVRAAVMANSASTVGANDTNGAAMEGGQCYQTNGGSVSNGVMIKVFSVPAGNYVVGWGYTMQGGATTTFSCLKNSLGAFLLG